MKARQHDSIIGVARAHDSACEHVTGSARYVDDMEVSEGMLHVAIGQSAIAHGSLQSLNLDKVYAHLSLIHI